MHHAEKTVTIYHKAWDADRGVDVYNGVVLRGVSFFARVATVATTDGLVASCEATCRIPAEIFPAHLGLTNGDLVCEGSHSTKPKQIADIKERLYTIVSITRNTTGRGAHVKVVCK